MAKKKITFESSLNRLEEILETMESENLDIEKSIALYKEGMETAVTCSESLKEYEKEILLLKESTKGIFKTEKFD